MDSLRSEIVESQKLRVDLMKWKLILAAAIGGVAIGITEVGPVDFDNRLLLCLLPMVNIYVDLMCRHLTLRILVIGKYLKECKDKDLGESVGDYEKFADDARKLPLAASLKACFTSENMKNFFKPSAFGLEKWALTWSSVIISALSIIYAMFCCPRSSVYLCDCITGLPVQKLPNFSTPTLIIWFCSIGIMATFGLDISFKIRKCGIELLNARA